MKKIIAVVILGLMVGCKGTSGKNGQNGASANISNYSGYINSDTQSVNVPDLGINSDLSVFVQDAQNTFVELPVYFPSAGYNVYYVASLGNVIIYNALKGGLTQYKVMVENVGSFSSRLK